MNQLINKVISLLSKKPSNAFLLFLSGFLFAQVMIVNVLYSRHPQGGWATDLGMFSTPTILVTFLAALSLCLFVLWRSVSSED
ncbi:hypothetical protein [uncultured Cocleimonas sp.]|uniref:hypothetical protein n=1 Tax=uncultured Cocleimonas sp. TaxID=1051587 RepID=UPI0026044CDE|nr:hypothetical protein [uncultured Cocleimonas sp.]